MKLFNAVCLLGFTTALCGLAYVGSNYRQPGSQRVKIISKIFDAVSTERQNTTSYSVTTTDSTTETSTTRKAVQDTKLIIHSSVARGSDLLVVNMFTKYFGQHLKFDNCEFSNCQWKPSSRIPEIAKADVVMAGFWIKFSTSKVPANARKKQTWLVYTREPAGLGRAKWDRMINEYDGTMAYTSDSDVPLPWSETVALPSPQAVDISIENRTKGAYVYVSNCKNTGYERLLLIKALRKYISIDIFGGCGNKSLCGRWDQGCRRKVHSQYRFYLSFENSLCTDYITEKFWNALRETDQVAVVAGGLSMDEYNRIAPPNSFIHAYNFTSFDQFGQYLRRLMDDDTEYKKYLAWKKEYIIMDRVPHSSACKLCKIANQPHLLKHNGQPLADNFNNETNCRQLPWSFKDV